MSDPKRLTEVFVELADSLVSDFDVVEFLTTLADRSAEVLSADGAGVIVRDDVGELRFVASSDDSSTVLELFELQRSEGPCLDCVRTGQPIVNQSMVGPGPWPAFRAKAVEEGFVMAHALPMRLRGDVVGAVNVFTTKSVPLSDDALAVGQALADIATISLLQERSRRTALVLNEQLQTALSSRIAIEQAKGVVAERRGVDMRNAFNMLRSYARGHGLLLATVAQSVVDGSLTDEELDRG